MHNWSTIAMWEKRWQRQWNNGVAACDVGTAAAVLPASSFQPVPKKTNRVFPLFFSRNRGTYLLWLRTRFHLYEPRRCQRARLAYHALTHPRLGQALSDLKWMSDIFGIEDLQAIKILATLAAVLRNRSPGIRRYPYGSKRELPPWSSGASLRDKSVNALMCFEGVRKYINIHTKSYARAHFFLPLFFGFHNNQFSPVCLFLSVWLAVGCLPVCLLNGSLRRCRKWWKINGKTIQNGGLEASKTEPKWVSNQFRMKICKITNESPPWERQRGAKLNLSWVWWRPKSLLERLKINRTLSTRFNIASDPPWDHIFSKF